MKAQALIENLPQTNEAYEYDGQLKHVYTMPEDVRWPYYYGCIPDITSGDGAPLDVFVVTNRDINRGEHVAVEIFEVLKFIDRGMDDPKLLAVPEEELPPNTEEIQQIYEKIVAFISAKKKHSGTEFKFEGLGGKELADSMLHR